MRAINKTNITKPNIFEANRTQINVGVKQLDDGSYSYTTVIVENPENYPDEALIEIANKEARSSAMLEGDVYILNGVDYRVSFTSDDGNGMLQVKAAFDVGLESTIIHFANGTNIPITSSEYLAFAQWFANKRNGFFV